MKDKTALRLAVKTYYDFQSMRIVMGGRLKIKKDGDDQIIPEEQADKWELTDRDREIFTSYYDLAFQQEQTIEKWIIQELKEYQVYTEYLKNIKGVGPMLAAIIIAEYDIYRATTVSKMWQFTGLNPGMVYGKKIVGTGSKKKIVTTEELIRGDKKTAGYLSPYNSWLRTKMCGVLAGSFLKSKSPYARYYYNLHMSQDGIKKGFPLGRLDIEDKWKDESEGHRSNAAKRYMIKMFLKDLYAAWRELEWLEVRRPYQEEYLGHTHGVEMQPDIN